MKNIHRKIAALVGGLVFAASTLLAQPGAQAATLHKLPVGRLALNPCKVYSPIIYVPGKPGDGRRFHIMSSKVASLKVVYYC